MAMRSPQPPRLEDDAEQSAPAELAPGATVAEVRLTDPDHAGARARGLTLADVEIARGNLANVIAPEIAIRRAAFTGTRLTGVEWTRGRIADAVFSDCRIDLATFAGTTFERTTFEGCRLSQTDFREALLRSVRFEHCDLTEADFEGVRIDGCELRSCTLDGLAGAHRLRGAAMPWADIVAHAGLFAGALGVRLLDEDRGKLSPWQD